MEIVELLKVALGKCESLSCVPTEREWWMLYEESMRLAVAGIVFAGVQKLPKGQWAPQVLLLMDRTDGAD